MDAIELDMRDVDGSSRVNNQWRTLFQECGDVVAFWDVEQDEENGTVWWKHIRWRRQGAQTKMSGSI